MGEPTVETRPPTVQARERRWLRRGVKVFGVGLAVLALCAMLGAAGTWLWLRTASGNAFLERRLEGLVAGVLVGGTFDIGHLETNVYNHATLQDVALTEPGGRVVIGADRIELWISPWPLLKGEVWARSLTVEAPVVDLAVDEDGISDLEMLFGAPSDEPAGPWEGLPVDIIVGLVRITDGRVAYATPDKRLEVVELDASVSARLEGKVLDVSDLQITGRMTSPEHSPLLVGGGLRWDGDEVSLDGLSAEILGSHLHAEGEVTSLGREPTADLVLSFEPLDLGGLDPLAGSPGIAGQWSGSLTASGPLSTVRVLAELEGVEGSRGRLVVEATVDAESELLSWHGTLRADALHVEDIVPKIEEETALSGVLVASGSGTSWPDDVRVAGHFDGGEQVAYGIPLEHLQANLDVQKGVLSLHPVRAKGEIGEPVIEGTLDLAKGPMSLQVKGALDPVGLARFGAEGLGGLGKVDLWVTGDLLADDMGLRVRGEIGVSQFTYEQDIRFDWIGGTVDVAVDKALTRVDADLRGRGGEVYGVQIEGLHDPRLVVRVTPDGTTRVNGQVGLQNVAMPGVLLVEAASAEWATRVDAASAVDVQASAELGSFELLMLGGTGGTVGIALADDVLGFDVALSDGRDTVLATRGELAQKSQRVTLAALAFEPVAGRKWVATEPVGLTLTDGGIGDAAIHMASDDQELHVTGTLGTTGVLDGTLTAVGLDLGLIGVLYPDAAGHLDGTADLDLRLGGRAQAAVIHGEVEVVGHLVPDAPGVLGVRGQLAGEAGNLVVDLHFDADEIPLFDLGGTLPVVLDLAAAGLDSEGEVHLSLVVLPGPFSRFAALTSSDLPEGRLSASVFATGALLDPTLDLAGVVEAPVEGWDMAGRMEFALMREAGALRGWVDALEGFERRGTVDLEATDRLPEVLAWAVEGGPEPDFGDYSLFADELMATVNLLGLPVDSLAAAAGAPAELAGGLHGTLSISGSANAPRLDGGLSWMDARVGPIALQGAFLSVTPTSEDAYALDLRVFFPNDGELWVRGDVPMSVDTRTSYEEWSPGALDLRVGGAGIPVALAEAFTADITGTKGMMAVTGTVGGPLFDPVPSLLLTLREGQLDYLPYGLAVSDLELVALVTQDRVELGELRLTTMPLRPSVLGVGSLFSGIGGAIKGGVSWIKDAFDGKEEQVVRRRAAIEAAGSVTLEEWSPHVVSGFVHLDDAWLSATREQQLQLSGEMSFAGAWPEVRVIGDVSLDHGLIVRDAASFLETAPLELDERIAVHRGGAGPPPKRVIADEPSIFEHFVVDVDVDIPRNLMLVAAFPVTDTLGGVAATITRADLAARLGGELQATIVGGEPSILGEVDIYDANVRVLRAAFDLTHGTVLFLGDPSEPKIDLAARMSSQGVDVDMLVEGTPSAPNVTFQSDQLSDQSQILGFLITGESTESMSAEEGEGLRDAMIGLFTQTVLGGSGLAGFTLEPDGSIRVRFHVPVIDAYGRYILVPFAETDENLQAFELEKQIGRGFVVSGTVGARKSWADLLWELRF